MGLDQHFPEGVGGHPGIAVTHVKTQIPNFCLWATEARPGNLHCGHMARTTEKPEGLTARQYVLKSSTVLHHCFHDLVE